jgi:prevent-host-death family protein
MTDPSDAPPPEFETVTATEAKNSFGAVLDRVIAERGIVAITKHDEIRAVLLSLPQYEALLAGQRDPLSDLEVEFESLLERMQTPKARAAGRALFGATPARLGRAAVASKRRRG